MSRNSNKFYGIFWWFAAILTSILAYRVNVVNGSSCPLVWAIVDFFFWPCAWLKWLICQDVNLTIIKEAFAFFLK